MDPNYFVTPATSFGPAEWVFFIASIVVALGGAYIGFFRADANSVRAQALQRLGSLLLASGFAGGILGGVGLAGIAVAPFWFTIVTVLFVVVVIVAIYYASAVYPKELAAAQAAAKAARPQRNQPARQVAATASSNEATEPVVRVASGRRDARRDRKRRNK
ncbi:MAG: hypothetical protein Fur005_14470 [Roseiflexaceae bacterium]